MVVDTPTKCPACGSTLSRERWSEGLCPGCVFELALESPSLMAEIESPDDEETLAYSQEAFSPGQILGKRYRIRSLLGRGGMGEVWRASDLKLRVDVALKALLPRLLEDDRALETLRQEVRVAREVMSPNVCRVFDLVELDGQELVSMEYIDGITLLDILRMRAPLDLTEAREIAVQFLAGLQAIHDADLVHRDVKPENLMMTRSGRVVLMDFGIAKGLAEGKAGTVSGTPAYMSPEHARGEALDARADVFSAGVVLAEMVAPEGLRTSEARQELWRAVHHEPPQIAESPWAPVLNRAIAKPKEQRHASAAALARALEEVTLRVAGAESLKPYPGLASFTEADAEYFFGRELEVEEMWKKLQRPHLLGLIGPSGAGKSSFLRAGLLPVIPTGWRAVVMSPGSSPLSALAQALVPELTGDTEALQLLAGRDDSALLSAVSRWRQQNDESLLIVDQFEELFTQNPPEVQERFSQLLSRLALEADVRVLLSMRDDFLSFCSHQESLRPIFSELTPLKPLTGGAVRRALVQPAVKCGYRFEDDSLVDEMVGEVGNERGALPMLAFAASRLWDHRNREEGLLTREAYEHVGGVGGALAQHAEVTMEKIGQDRVPMVRELFLNLVTAQGTRAARDREDLLSVFGDDDAAPGEVLNTLIDARLLTSYEVPSADEEGTTHHRIEIIHESLLSNWPRLVRWQMQDADSAQLRDQIRQAAQMWEERGRPHDLLWTGTSFGEYRLWRERYEGGLSTAEEAFGNAMVYRAERQKRRRRVVTAAAFGILLVVLGVISWFGWQAELERRRAEAGRLLTLAELEIESYPTAALAWVTKSLELADTLEGRMMALRALQESPPARIVTQEEDKYSPLWNLVFSPRGEWLAYSGNSALLLQHREGGEFSILASYPTMERAPRMAFPTGDELVADQEGEFRWLSVPEGRETRHVEGERGRLLWPRGEGYFSVSEAGDKGSLRWWPFAGGKSRLVGEMPDWHVADLNTTGAEWDSVEWQPEWSAVAIDPSGRWLAYSRDRALFLRPLEEWGRAAQRLGEHESNIVEIALHANGELAAARDETGELRVWTNSGRPEEPLRTYDAAGLKDIRFGPSGRWLAAHGMVDGVLTVRLWDLSAPQSAEPLRLKRIDYGFAVSLSFHPREPWLATANVDTGAFWPLPESHPWVLRGHEGRVEAVAFTPDGEWLVSAAGDGVRAWPLRGQSRGAARVLLDRPLIAFTTLAVHPSGESLAVGSRDGSVLVVPLNGGSVRELPGRWAAEGGGMTIDFSPDGQRLAAVPFFGPDEQMFARVWDLASEAVQILDPVVHNSLSLTFIDDRHLRLVGDESLGEGPTEERVFDLEDGSVTKTLMVGQANGAGVVSHDGSLLILLVWDGGTSYLVRRDLETGTERRLLTHGDSPFVTAIDSSNQWLVSADFEGLVRVGPVSGEEPHVLFGHRGLVRSVAVSPDGRWIASGGEDGTVRVWPTPDLSKRPLHTLPPDELIATLHSLTNLRIVEDPDSSTGWKLDYSPFPGWAEVPEW